MVLHRLIVGRNPQIQTYTLTVHDQLTYGNEIVDVCGDDGIEIKCFCGVFFGVFWKVFRMGRLGSLEENQIREFTDPITRKGDRACVREDSLADDRSRLSENLFDLAPEFPAGFRPSRGDAPNPRVNCAFCHTDRP